MILTESDVREVLSMSQLIDAMEQALKQFSAGQVDQPVRQVLMVGGENYFGVMPAASNHPAAVGAKLVTVYHGNHARGLTSHLATIILLDHETGALQALLDGRYITEARTAAVSAVSARHLAKVNASTLALIGSGVQARSHLDAMLKVRPITHVRIWSRNAAHRDALAASASAEYDITVTAAPDAATAVRGADIIVLATASPTPVIRNEDVSDGAHICAVGACRPDQREVPTALVARARVYVDSRAGALKEAGDLLLPIGEGAIASTHIVGELGELLLGRVLGRTSPAQVTFFESLGMAIEDIVAAELAVRHARARGIGRPLSLA